jgi:hypothetical protein
LQPIIEAAQRECAEARRAEAKQKVKP